MKIRRDKKDNTEKREKIEKTNEHGFAKVLGRFWLPAVVVLGVIAVVISTVSIYREEVLEIDPTVEYADGDAVYLPSSPLDTLNPVVSQSEDTFYFSKLLYDGLFDYDEHFNVTPVLVESYETDPVKASVKIKLKDGIKWHDGKKLTAYDVRFTVNVIKSRGSACIYYDKAAAIHSVVVKDDLNLTVYFNNNTDGSLDDLIFPILPSKSQGSVGQFLRTVDNFQPIGTGQYKFASRDLKEIKLTPNEDYFGEKASANVTVELLPDKSLADSMMEIQKVTCFVSDASDRRTMVSDKNFTMLDMVSNNVEFLVFNTNAGVFKDRTARQAAALAIDTQTLLSNGYMDDAVPADTIYYPGFMGVEETGDKYAYNRDRARTLFEQAGYKDRDLNGAFEDEEGNGIDIKILVNAGDVTRNAAARLIEADLTAAGFSVTLESLPWEEYQKAVGEQDFDILMAGYSMEASYDLRDFFNGRCPWKYTNAQLLSAAGELEKLHTAEEYTQYYTQLKALLLEELPYYALGYKKMGLIGVPYFKAEKLPTFESIYKNCGTWSWRYVKQEAAETGAETP